MDIKLIGKHIKVNQVSKFNTNLFQLICILREKGWDVVGGTDTNNPSEFNVKFQHKDQHQLFIGILVSLSIKCRVSHTDGSSYPIIVSVHNSELYGLLDCLKIELTNRGQNDK